MNFLALESKFRELEKKEGEVRNYFDPRSSGGKKHYFIHDLKADFQYDNLMYGFSRYLDDSQTSLPKPETAPAQPPPPKEVSQPRNRTAGGRRVFAKRKQPEVFEMKERLNKDRYIGLFSATKITKPEILDIKPDSGAADKPDIWRTSAADTPGVSNPAARQSVFIPERQVRTAASVPFKRDTANLTPVHPRKSKTAGKKTSSVESLTGLNLSIDMMQDPSRKEVGTQKAVRSEQQTPKAALDLKPLIAEGRSSQLSEDSERMMSSNVEMVKKTAHEWELYSKGESQATIKTPSVGNTERPPKDAEPPFPAISEESIPTPKSFLDPISDSFDEIPLVKIKLLPTQINRKTRSYSVALTDISDPAYIKEIKAGLQCDEAGFLRGTDEEMFDPLKSLSWVGTPKDLIGKTIRLQVFGIGIATVKLIDRFLHFGARNEEGEVQIQREIKGYEDYLKEKLGLERSESPSPNESPAKTKSIQRYLSDMIQQARTAPPDPDIPQSLFRLPDMGSPHKKVTPALIESKLAQSHVTLSMGGGFYSVVKPNPGPAVDLQPFPEQKPSSHFEGFILQSLSSANPTPRNPMTSVLYKFRSEANAFKPVSYGANLSIFEAQDMIEERYPGKKQRSRPREVQEAPNLGVSGHGLRQDS
jgi:hypothetical protein